MYLIWIYVLLFCYRNVYSIWIWIKLFISRYLEKYPAGNSSKLAGLFLGDPIFRNPAGFAVFTNCSNFSSALDWYKQYSKFFQESSLPYFRLLMIENLLYFIDLKILIFISVRILCTWNTVHTRNLQNNYYLNSYDFVTCKRKMCMCVFDFLTVSRFF